MATILTDDQKKKPNSFGDAAAAASSPGTQQLGASIPAPLPMLTAGTPPIPQTAQVRANDAAAAAGPIAKAAVAAPVPGGAVAPPPAAPAPVPGGAVAPPLDAQAASDRAAASGFIGGVKDLNDRAGAAIMDTALLAPRAVLGAYDTAVVRPVRAAGINMAYTSPLLTPPGSDPSSMTPMYDRIRAQDAAAAAAAAAAAGAPQATQAQVRRVDNAVMPGGAVRPVVPVGIPSAVQTDAATPVAAVPGDTAAAPSGPGGVGTTSADRIAQIQRDGQHVQDMVEIQKRIDASNGMAPGLGIINGNYADRNAAFNDSAALRLAAEHTSWSPRRGFQANDAAIRAASLPIENRARAEESAARNAADLATSAQRDAGETARLGISEAGLNQRSAATNARLGVSDAINRDAFGLKKTAAEFDNRSRARLEAAQLELQQAKTPEAVRAATQKVLAMGGKEAAANRYTVVPDGQTVDPATGQAVREASQVLDNQTGQIVQPGGAPSALPPGLVVGAPTKQADGSYVAGNKTVTIKGGKVTEIK